MAGDLLAAATRVRFHASGRFSVTDYRLACLDFGLAPGGHI
jgi:hypothetical protein